nr:prepilin peptidase [Mesobacterium pallidum]
MNLDLALSATAALVFAPFVWAICLHVAWSDLSAMKIRNTMVLALAGVFVLLGPVLMPLDTYGWRLVTMVATLAVTFVLNAAGVMGAGDSKFIAAAAPYIAPPDVFFVMILFAACLLGAFVTHRAARVTGIGPRLAPGWESWTRKRDFPMGFPLGGTLAIYLCLALFFGA